MLSTNIGWIANLIGISALVSFFIAFYPAISHVCNINLKQNKLILKLSQIALLATIFLGLLHGLLMTQKENIEFNSIATYWNYAEGLLTLNLLIFLAFVGSELKFNLKKITYFTYAALFFLGCHLWQQILHLW